MNSRTPRSYLLINIYKNDINLKKRVYVSASSHTLMYNYFLNKTCIYWNIMCHTISADTERCENNIIACTVISRQLLGKHVPAVTDTYVTIEVLLEMEFLLCPCKRVIRRTIEARIVQLEGSRRSDRT
jgi:hypothetical protein